MLSSFSVKNFRSILDLNLDLSFAEGKAPNGYKDLPIHVFFQMPEKRIVPVMAIFGPNASGKSNFVKAIWCLQRLLTNSIKGLYQPNIMHNSNSPTEFKIDFFINGDLYSYVIGYNEHTIEYEILSINGKYLFNIKNNELASLSIANQSYPKEKLRDIFLNECCIKFQNLLYQTRPFLQEIAQNYTELNDYITKAFYYIKQLFIYFPASFPDIPKILEDAEPVDIFLYETANILKKFDIDIESIIYDKNICFIHKCSDGMHIRLDIREESSGTQVLTKLIMVMILALKRGTPIIIDEIDKSIHPFILNCIIDIFKDQKYNTTNTQLIFTSHTTDILENNNIRMSEIGLIDKTRNNGTKLKRASDYDNIRNIHNFRNLYCSGKLSSIPHPYH